MAIGGPDRATRLAQLRTYAVVQVRSGYADAGSVRADVAAAAREEFPDPAQAAAEADRLIAQAHGELARDAAGWGPETSVDRFLAALRELEGHDVVVLEAVDDHWAADAELRRRAAAGAVPRGIAYFTPADVWHAVEHQMLELNVWHGDSANVRAGDPLVTLVEQVLARHGIASHFDEGRLEVTLAWNRRLGPDCQTR